ncbi:Arm DNA-binding domain-containing protein [Sphingobium yanoikuyae]|nr:Arm DNA-binding domain-containing protein [Sphingobium yanoikuyae]
MLSAMAVSNAKPIHRPYKLSDGRGLYLMVMPNGARYWRFYYTFLKKQKTLSVGVYPDVSLALARERREELRRILASGEDPSSRRKADAA